MAILQALSALAWLTLLACSAMSLVRVVRGNARYYDPLLMSFFMTAILILGFNLRALLAPDETLIRSTLYILSIALACFKLVVLRFYRNG